MTSTEALLDSVCNSNTITGTNTVLRTDAECQPVCLKALDMLFGWRGTVLTTDILLDSAHNSIIITATTAVQRTDAKCLCIVDESTGGICF